MATLTEAEESTLKKGGGMKKIVGYEMITKWDERKEKFIKVAKPIYEELGPVNVREELLWGHLGAELHPRE